MIQEDKKLLLLKDLCARLPYGVKVQTPVMNDEITLTCGDISAYFFNPDNELFLKPYLRPMSSMTEEENEEYIKRNLYGFHWDFVDWCNSKYLDYRSLIPMGLALEASKGMYN